MSANSFPSANGAKIVRNALGLRVAPDGYRFVKTDEILREGDLTTGGCWRENQWERISLFDVGKKCNFRHSYIRRIN